MPDYTIRFVEPDDLTGCHTLECHCFPPAEAASLSAIDTRINQYPEGFMVAEQAGRIIGQVNSGSIAKNDISDEAFKQLIGHDPEGDNIVIFSLAVHPDHQGQHIGMALLNAFIEHARDLGKRNILLLCKDNLVNFYSRFGFRDAGLSASTHGGVEWHTMTMPL